MMFGKRSRRARGTGDDTSVVRRFAAVAAALTLCGTMLFAAGCGSGSDSGNNNGGTTTTTTGSNQSTDAVLTGVVADRNNNDQPVVNARVIFGDRQATTGNDGRFVLPIPSNTSGGVLIVQGPALQNGEPGYYNSGYVGQNGFQLGTAGFPIPALQNQQQLDLGTILIFGVSGPPPPPIFPS